MSGEGGGQMQNKIFLRGCLWLFIMQTGQFWLRLVKENIRPITICQLSFYLVHASSHTAPENRHMSNTESVDTWKKRFVLMVIQYCTTSSDKQGELQEIQNGMGQKSTQVGVTGVRGISQVWKIFTCHRGPVVQTLHMQTCWHQHVHTHTHTHTKMA